MDKRKTKDVLNVGTEMMVLPESCTKQNETYGNGCRFIDLLHSVNREYFSCGSIGLHFFSL